MCSRCLGGERYVELQRRRGKGESWRTAVASVVSNRVRRRHGVFGGRLGAVLALRRHLREPPRVGHSHIGRPLRRRRFERRRDGNGEEGKTQEESEADADDDAGSEHRGLGEPPTTAAATAAGAAADGEGDDGPGPSHVGRPTERRVYACARRGDGHHGAGRERARVERRRHCRGSEPPKCVGRREETKVHDDSPVRVLEQVHLPGLQQGVHVEVQHQDALQYAHREERSSMQVSERAGRFQLMSNDSPQL